MQITRDAVAIPAGIVSADSHFTFDLIMGIVLSISLFAVAVGKVKRVSAVAGSMVPAMVLFYFLITGYLLLSHITELPAMLALIVTDAFSDEAVSGGVLGCGNTDRCAARCIFQ